MCLGVGRNHYDSQPESGEFVIVTSYPVTGTHSVCRHGLSCHKGLDRAACRRCRRRYVEVTACDIANAMFLHEHMAALEIECGRTCLTNNASVIHMDPAGAMLRITTREPRRTGRFAFDRYSNEGQQWSCPIQTLGQWTGFEAGSGEYLLGRVSQGSCNWPCF